MGRRGTKPAPTPLKIAKGTQKSRIPKGEPAPIAGEPEAPDYLDAVGKAKFVAMIALLKSMGIFSMAFVDAIAGYAKAYSDMIDAEIQLQKRGKTVPTVRGGLQPSPYVRISLEAVKQMGRFQAEFGLTASSSSRLATGKSEAPRDDLEEFLTKRG